MSLLTVATPYQSDDIIDTRSSHPKFQKEKRFFFIRQNRVKDFERVMIIQGGLQHTALHCNTLLRTATDCKTFFKEALAMLITRYISLQHIGRNATYCNALQYVAAYCNALQRTATHCNTLEHVATHCNSLQRTATYCNALQHTATHCNTVQESLCHL